METKKYLNEKDIADYANYRLCYVDEIPETYTDYDEKSKALMETDEYKQYKEAHTKFMVELMDKRLEIEGYRYLIGSDYTAYDRQHDPYGKFKLDFKEYPDLDFASGYTHYLYFTDNFEEQWGDDWDDAPYEHNAGTPYDDEGNILVVPIDLAEYENIWFPKDYGINSPWSVDLINAGAIPWVFVYDYERKHIPSNSFSLMGGDSLELVIKKLNNYRLNFKV